MASDVMLGYSDHSADSRRGRLMDEVVVDVINACRRRGKLFDTAVVRELVEREWVGFGEARVQTYLPQRASGVAHVPGTARPDVLSTGSEKESDHDRTTGS